MMKPMMMMVSSLVWFGIAGAGCMTDDTATSDDGEPTSEASSALTSSRVCWSSAGLYDSPCGSVRESMPNGATVDIRGLQQFFGCNFEYWTPVTHHATGHQGWARTAALCP